MIFCCIRNFFSTKVVQQKDEDSLEKSKKGVAKSFRFLERTIEELENPEHASKSFIGNYEVLKTLGEGSSCKVKLGAHTETGKAVALKLVKTSFWNTADRASIEREIKVMKTLSHQNIIKLIDFDGEARYSKKNGNIINTAVLVLEYAEGQALMDYLMTTGPLSELQARTYFKSLVAVLEYLHAQGVSHRDLKPENLLLDCNFQLKVGDFGLCSYLAQDNEGTEQFVETVCGTSSYVAPEVLAHRKYKGSKADIWSAGVNLFIFVGGHPPFNVANSSDWWFSCIINKQYDRFWAAHFRAIPPFSQELREMISRIFVVDPEERCSLEQIKLHPWFQKQTVDASTLKEEMMERKQVVESHKHQELIECAALKATKKTALSTAFANNTCRNISFANIPQHLQHCDLVYAISSPSELFNNLLETIVNAKGEITNKNENKFKIKANFGHFTDKSRLVCVCVQIFEVREVCGIHISRRAGSCFEFRRIRSLLEESINDRHTQKACIENSDILFDTVDLI